MNLLVIVDMQNDFVTGPLGTKRAKEIVPKLVDYIKGFDGDIIYTKDTHDAAYPLMQEGKRLPVPHCIKGTVGHDLIPELANLVTHKDFVIEKPTFGSMELAEVISHCSYDMIYFVGVCTGICVISNAVLAKAADPEARICILKDLCGCVTKESHETALKAMELLQMDVAESDDL